MPKVICEWNNCKYNSARLGTVWKPGECQCNSTLHFKLDHRLHETLECCNYEDGSKIKINK